MANNYISYGMKGDNVKALQEQLNGYGAGLQADGIFGALTKSALENFQRDNKITADGIYGNETMGVFNSLRGTQQGVGQPTASSIPIADANGIQPFNYDYSTDPLYKNQAALMQSQIAQQMAARGILNSTIDQERTAQALGALGLDYKNQAYSQYTTDRAYQTTRQRQAKEDAWTTAQERGYFNNAEALLWGLTPGTKTASAKAREAAAAQAQTNARNSAYNASAKSQSSSSAADYKTVSTTFRNNFKVDPIKAIDLVKNMGLSEDQLISLFDSTPLDENEMSVWDYLNEKPIVDFSGSTASSSGVKGSAVKSK